MKNAAVSCEKIKKKKSVEKVEIDLNRMIDIHKKLSNGVSIDQKDVSVLVLGGIINIISQHDALEDIEKRIEEAECKDVTNRTRIEALENWVLKQDDLIKDLNKKLDTMDANGAIIQESSEIETIKKQIVSLEIDMKSDKSAKSSRKNDEQEIGNNTRSKSVKCEDCGRLFSRNCDFEEHLEEHQTDKLFECKECGKKFYLEWRLRKHTNLHKEKGKYCHYFNNGEPCPFEKIGCMFLHERSGNCRFKACRNRKCQFEHIVVEKQDDEHMEADVEVENPSDMTSYGENDCHFCDKVFECVDSLCEHFRNDHVEYHQNIMEAAAKRSMEAHLLC